MQTDCTSAGIKRHTTTVAMLSSRWRKDCIFEAAVQVLGSEWRRWREMVEGMRTEGKSQIAESWNLPKTVPSL
jgi:hypothetical protein